MTKNQAKQIFEKYNPADAVTRCPSGRASFRKQLDTYAVAAVNLYGIISIEEFVEIFNSQNTEQTNGKEVFTLLLPVVLKDKYYCFYKDYIVHYFAIDNFDLGEYWLREQGDKPRFVPDKTEFLEYEDAYYEDEVQELHWIKVLKFILKEWPNNRNIVEFFRDLKDHSELGQLFEIGKLLKKYDLTFSSEKQIKVFFDLFKNASNNTRMWSNKGHSPNELGQFRKKEYQKNGQDKINFREHRKIGANEPCPCGSGKKYKKCCRLVEESKTAQLHWSERTLFYETWYGLMDFVNKKKKVIDAEIKPIYPNPVSDELVYKVREVLWQNPELIDDYLASVNLQEEKTELLKSWRNRYIKGMFLLVEYKSEYAIMIGINEKKDNRLYGVLGISRSLADTLQCELPVQLSTVLLPFRDKIIYDSFMTTMNVSFGEGIKEMLSEMYINAKEKGIITRLEY